jgi:anti-sigma regulatory factor (Ser/Thr protein kinase)
MPERRVRLKRARDRYDLQVVSIDLPRERSAAAGARRFVRDATASWGLSAEEIADLELLASELVTNAVLHARSTSRLTLEQRADRVRVTVADQSIARPRRRDYGPDAVTGRGMLLVDRLAHDWGVDADSDGGKRVWFELVLSDSTERLSR